MTGPGPPAGPSHVPAGRLLWSLVEDAVVVDRTDGGGALRVAAGDRHVDVADPSETVREVLSRMRLGPVALENVAGLRPSFDAWASGSGGGGGSGGDCGPWRRVKAVLDDLGAMVVLSLGSEDSGDGLLVSTMALAAERSRPPGLNLPAVDPVRPVRIRPTARLDRGPGGERVLTDPGSPFRVVLHTGSVIAAVEELIRAPRSARALAGPCLHAALAVDVVAFLTGGQMLVPAEGWSHTAVERPQPGIAR